jgi:hypothetical protein
VVLASHGQQRLDQDGCDRRLQLLLAKQFEQTHRVIFSQPTTLSLFQIDNVSFIGAWQYPCPVAQFLQHGVNAKIDKIL